MFFSCMFFDQSVPLGFEINCHLLDLRLQLVYQVTALRLQHVYLALQICNLCLVCHLCLFCFAYLRHFLLLQLSQLLVEVGYLGLEQFDLLVELGHLACKVLVGCFEDVVEAFYFCV